MENNDAIAGSSITILSNSKGVLTDKRGRFTITMPGGLEGDKLIVSHTGYYSDTILKTTETDITIFLKPAYNNMNEVVVSGTMKAVTKLNSPIPVEVYSQSFFKKNPSPTLFESLTMVNGVQPQLNCSVCNTGDIHINGLEGPYAMILVDGMPIVSSLSSVYGLQGIPQSIIKKVEVVKGPASTLYGSEAVAGLVNIITKDPESAPVASADLMVSSIGEYNADVSAKWKMNKWASLLGLNYFNYQVLKDINDDNFTDVTLQKRVSVFNKWSKQRINGKRSSVAVRYVNENRWGGELQWNASFRGSDSLYGESIYTNRVELIGTYDLPGKEKIKFDYSYNYHHQDSYYGTTKYKAGQHTAFTQLVWDGQIGKWDLLAGTPFRYVWYDDNTTATADSSLKTNKPSVTYLPGVFLQSERTWNKLTLLSGIRYDYNSIHGSIVTPRVSFKYAAGLRGTLRLTAGSGYRVVNLFTEDHAALTGARDIVINEALKPEKSWNVNTNYNGWTKWGKAVVSIDASLFYTYFTNQITGDFLTDPQKIIYDNLDGYAVSRGLSANFELIYPSSLKVLYGFTLMDVFREEREYEKMVKKHQLFAPAFSGNYAISYNLHTTGITIDLTGKINGPMYLPVVPNDFRPETSPLHAIMNLQLTKKVAHSVEVYGGAKNLLNFIPKNPILRPFDPFDKTANDVASNPNGYTFDPTYNYAPIQGLKGFLGVRWTMD